jgi:Mn-dependent DtxR family transcriptional regulator
MQLLIPSFDLSYEKACLFLGPYCYQKAFHVSTIELYEEGEDDDGLKISHLMSEDKYRDVWRRLDVVAHPEKEETRSNSGKSKFEDDMRMKHSIV